MPSGIYERNTPATYRGFPRVRMVRRYNGEGTDAICLVPCAECGFVEEKTASAIRKAERGGYQHLCKVCNVRRLHPIGGKRG